MSSRGYRNISDKFKSAMNKNHNTKQFKNLIKRLKSQYRFVIILETHTGFGRREDGSVMAPPEWWAERCKGEFKDCRKFQHGWPVYTQHLHEMFDNVLVDGSTSYRPGYDDEADDSQEEDDWETELRDTPISRSSAKRGSTNQSTADSPRKRSKGSSGSGYDIKARKPPMMKVLASRVMSQLDENAKAEAENMQQLRAKDLAMKEELHNRRLAVKEELQQKRIAMVKEMEQQRIAMVKQMEQERIAMQEEAEQKKNEKIADEIRRCMDLVHECGISDVSDEFFAATSLFQEPYHRIQFLGFRTNASRVAWLQKWAQKNKV